jgi:energy-coupling factor transporter ATP-binding protein EcfA2
MSSTNLKLSIANCRAIGKAEIELSEITILAGVNASGKSTIARMFHDLVELSAEYERLLSATIWRAFVARKAFAILNFVRQTGAAKIDIPMDFVQSEADLRSGKADVCETLRAFADYASNLLRRYTEKMPESSERAVAALKRRLDAENKSTDEIADDILSEANSKILEYRKKLEKRSYKAYQEIMRSSNPLFEGFVELKEGNDVVYSINRQDLKEAVKPTTFGGLGAIYGIKRAIYIESPMKSVPSRADDQLVMRDGFLRIRTRTAEHVLQNDPELFKVLMGHIVGEQQDEPFVSDDEVKWFYRRDDGSQFELSDCATGIKALSILNILYEKGWLDEETLLVIDEPEAHLHPQWIVEYARILILLSKRLKVRLLLASHSPDMINALQTLGKKENMQDGIRFYLAEPSADDKYRYNYTSLGFRTAPIFKSFNVVFSKISEYVEGGE